MKIFGPDEDAYIRAHYMDNTLSSMGTYLGRSIGSVYGRMKKLGCVVPHEIAQARMRSNMALCMANGKAHRYKPGNVPANKGQQLSSEMYAKAQATMFRPGHRPANWKPVGSERITKDGYIMVKITEITWELKHRVVFAAHHGEIPHGMMVKFVDGNTANITIDNLYLSDRKMNMSNNSIHQLPPEIKQACHSIGVIKRRIRNVSKNIKTQDNEQ